VLEYVVDATTYHLGVEDGVVRVRPGAAAAATVRFSTDRATAAAVAQGEASAQHAFMTGSLRIGGDVTAILAHHAALARLDDVFAPVRAATTY
jgi:hypothetical protein